MLYISDSKDLDRCGNEWSKSLNNVTAGGSEVAA